MDAATQTMIRNLEEKTGRSLDAWVKEVRKRKLEKHGEIVKVLKEEFGFTHGYANLVAIAARDGLERPDAADGEDAVFAGGRAAMRPVYDAVSKAIAKFGKDIEVSPKKAYVSFRRKKQFALVQPTNARLDLGLNLKGVEPDGRLESAAGFNAMCSHRVRLSSPKDVDREVVAWLKKAYDAAG